MSRFIRFQFIRARCAVELPPRVTPSSPTGTVRRNSEPPPLRELIPSAGARKLFPTPAGPVSSTLCLPATYSEVDSSSTCGFISPRAWA